MAKRQCDPTSGKIGQQVYMIGRNGQVVRQRVIPANPRTVTQRSVRAAFANVSGNWDKLTPVQQAAWISDSKNYMSKTRLGMNGVLTPNQRYVQVAMVAAILGETIPTDPPGAPIFDDLVPQALVAAIVSNAVKLTLTCPTALTQSTMLRGAAPVKNGVYRVPQMELLGLVPAASQGTSDITDLYTAKFGVPARGSKVFVGCCVVSNAQESPITAFSAIVPPT
jgi:hypothetical protein